jgi:hypothetical protein
MPAAFSNGGCDTEAPFASKVVAVVARNNGHSVARQRFRTASKPP